MDINVVTLVGRLVSNPDFKQSAQSAVAVATFTVATNHRYVARDGRQAEQVAYVPCKLFGAAAGWAKEHKKGEPIAVSGHLVTEEWERDGRKHWWLGLHVDRVQFFHRAPEPNGGVPVPVSGPEDQPPF